MEISLNSLTEKSGATVSTLESQNEGKISSDFDTFLKMLTVQMQNQDPLNPVDSSDYAVQLATFSGVEQQVQTNELLANFAAQSNASGLAEVASWVGMDARVAAPAQWSGTPISIVPNVASGADYAELVVEDGFGLEVQRLEVLVDDGPITWAGVDASGNALPLGTYSFKVVSYQGETELSEATAETYGRVTEVRMTAGKAELVLASGAVVPASEVSALRSIDQS